MPVLVGSMLLPPHLGYHYALLHPQGALVLVYIYIYILDLVGVVLITMPYWGRVVFYSTIRFRIEVCPDFAFLLNLFEAGINFQPPVFF